MAEFSNAFLEGLARMCSDESELALSRHRKTASKSLRVLSQHSYSQELDELRGRLVATSDVEDSHRRETAYEWFLDNYYLINETAQTLAEDVPANFYFELPSLVVTEGEKHTRLPRIYVLARELIEEISEPPNRVALEAFLDGFQRRVQLSIGELWAFPAMLRAVCLEKIVESLSLLSAEDNPETELDDLLSVHPAMVAFAVRTLIELKTIPWRLVFEHCSLVHRELLEDPAAVYSLMDFATCDRYRRIVEGLALRSGCDELTAAAQANALAQEASAEGHADGLQNHVGYYLVGNGRYQLERTLGAQLALRIKVGRTLMRLATPVYLLSIAVVTLCTIGLLAAYLVSVSAGPIAIILASMLALVPSSGFAIALVQWVITNLIVPERLPRLAVETGIGDENRTLVVIPTLFGDVEEVHELVRRLEIHYLANPDPNLGFAILADYTDALQETTPADEVLVARARAGIDLLNQRYGESGSGPFHLLVRERRLNALEGVWMGWERKRGKLEEFNRLLAGDRDTSYSLHVGDAGGLEDIRFVITLDSDTELPKDAARRLVGTLAHPLNRAQFDGDRLCSGYTVLQPRLDISPEASHRSRFSGVFAGDTGLDIYSRAVSNVYQDFFGSGVYVGKGIYDVDAFRRCLEGRVPENSLLSHDLFEGIYGRTGLVTDVVLFEDYPQNYLSYARRLHRWIRGDWQLLPWLRSRVPAGAGRLIANPFSQIDRWKVVDNLRRSLLPIALLAMFVSGWTWLPGNP